MMSALDPLRSVLVATDLGAASDHAIREGVAHARSMGLRAVLCHVLASAASEAELAEAIDAVRARARQVLASGCDDLVADVVVGSPEAAIRDAAVRHRAELVVLGAAASSGLARRLVGGFFERVLTEVACAVEVARSPHGMGVLVATDLSDASLPEVREGARVAAARRVPLTVLHCVEPHEPVETSASALRLRREHLASMIVAIGLQAEVAVVAGASREAIVRATTGVAANLLVVGSRGRSTMRARLLGATAELVVGEAPCSVRVVHI